MPIIILDSMKKGRREARTLSRGDWRTCETALRWKRDGTLKRIKSFLYNSNRRGNPISFWRNSKPARVKVRFEK